MPVIDPNCPPIPTWGGYQPNCNPGHGPNHGSRLEIKSLNEYQGYFTTPEGTDFPVSVVANNIEEATKILRLPGAFTPMGTDPILVKFIKGRIGSAIPVHHIGFDTVVYPPAAIISGAYATPVHYEVVNGDNVIFQAFSPFGWKFIGWYEGNPESPEAEWKFISDKKIAEVDVYDPYRTRLCFIAKYEFEPSLRNGRYIDIMTGKIYDLNFTGYSNYEGRMIYSPDTANEYDWAISVLDIPTTTINCIPDPLLTQPEQIPVTFTYTLSPIGINLVVQAVPLSNPFAWSISTMLNLKWLQDVTA